MRSSRSRNLLFLIGTALTVLLSAGAYAAPTAVPSSGRSQRAVERVRPVLEQALAPLGVRWGVPVFLRIFKQPGRLEVWIEKEGRFILLKSYPICYFSGELGPKQRVGDNQSPEGFYTVTPAQLNPASSYHLSFNLGYPNEFDRANGRTGNLLMVHGSCVSIGCYAMGDAAIEEIFTMIDAAFRGGQKRIAVHAFPFPMDDETLRLHQSSPWRGFWADLKAGYDYFEQHRRLPEISVKNRRYAVGAES